MELVNLRDCPEYLSVLARWHQVEWLELNPGLTLQGRIDKMQLYLNDESIPSTFVAIDQGRAVGSAAIVDNDLETRPDLSPWMASVFVIPGYRKRGVGSKLVKKIMAFAGEIKIDTLYLFTPDQRAFYQRLGWSHLSTELYLGHEIRIMAADLTDQRSRQKAAKLRWARRV